jgi:hypothetical protein
VKSMKLAFVLASAAAPLLAMTACGGPDGAKHDATFVGADRLHIKRTLQAASGLEVTYAGVVGALSAITASSCPQVTHDGNRALIKANGCTESNGETFDGTITAENMPDTSTYDATKPMKLTFDGWTMTAKGDIPVVLDGTITATETGYTSELSFTDDNLLTHSALEVSRDASGVITAKDGASVEIDGLGSASVSGTWRVATVKAPSSGKITVTGKDTIVFNLDAPDSNGCYSYTINGAAADGVACLDKPNL